MKKKKRPFGGTGVVEKADYGKPIHEIRIYQMKLESDNKALTKKVDKMSKEIFAISKAIKGFAEIMNKVAYINECTDVTLCKVLHAIRQNEFLQAWYPEQAVDKKKVTQVKYEDDQ